MNKSDEKLDAIRIYTTVCDEYEQGKYAQCAKLIEKNKGVLSAYLSPSQDGKVNRIYAYSIFTIIEDKWLTGNKCDASKLYEKHSMLLDSCLPTESKRTLEELNIKDYVEECPISEKELNNTDFQKENGEYMDKSGWTLKYDELESIIQQEKYSNNKTISEKSTVTNNTDKKKHKKKNPKFIFVILAAIVLCCAFFLKDDIQKLLNNNENGVIDDEGTLIIGSENAEGTPQEDLQVMEAAKAAPELEYTEPENAGDSIISSNVKTDENGYILPTDSKLITEADLQGFDSSMIRLAINEMFARKGYAFNSTGDYFNYFCQFAWYNPDSELSIDDAEAKFNETEKSNIKVLLSYVPAE